MAVIKAEDVPAHTYIKRIFHARKLIRVTSQLIPHGGVSRESHHYDHNGLVNGAIGSLESGNWATGCASNRVRLQRTAC